MPGRHARLNTSPADGSRAAFAARPAVDGFNRGDVQETKTGVEETAIAGGKRVRPRWDSDPRITDLQSVPLVHLGTRPWNLAG